MSGERQTISYAELPMKLGDEPMIPVSYRRSEVTENGIQECIEVYIPANMSDEWIANIRNSLASLNPSMPVEFYFVTFIPENKLLR